MKNIFKSTSYWIVALLVGAIIFSIGINMNVAYVSETKILIIPKNERIALNLDQVVENAKQIPRFLAFYENFVKEYPEVGNNSLNIPSKRKLDHWRSIVETKRVDKSGVIILKVTENNPTLADSLGRNITKNLAVAISKYYSIKDEIDIRIVDGPLIYAKSQANIPLWILIALIFGLIGSAFLQSVVEIFFKHNKQYESKPLEYSQSEEIAAEMTHENYQADTASSVPANLPIIEELEQFPSEEIEYQSENEESGYREATSDEVKNRLNSLLKKEASPEDVKKRLNELLNGEM